MNRYHRLLARCASVSVGLASLAAAVAIFSLIASRSSLVLIAVATCLIAGITCVGLAFAPATVWDRLVDTARAYLQPVPHTRDSKSVGSVLIIAGLLAYIIQIVVLFPRNSAYEGQDEQAFMVTAAEVADRGGTWPLLHDLYTGRFAEANRHPAYIWLLSFAPEFAAGKWLSATIGLATFLVVIALSVRSRGWLRSGLLSVLLGMNYCLGKFSVIVGCEILLVGVIGIFWMLLTGWSDGATEDAPATTRRKSLLAVVCGCAMALAWLTKGTGLLLAGGCAMWLTSRELWGRSTATARTSWRDACLVACLFVSVWLAAASPLISRNVVRHGSPFYNVNSWLLFVDEYEDPALLAQRMTTAQAASHYLATHRWTEVVQREASGLLWELFILLRSLGPPPLEDARVIPGAIVAALALVGGLVNRRPERLLLAIWLLCCLPLFAWYVPIAAGERFVLPLLIPILCYASDGLHHAGARARRMSVATT